VAPSSSANKVAKLASRGKGKKVRFQSGTTFPTVVAVVLVVMIALVAYAKASLPGEETGPPQPGDEWAIAYSFRVCDIEYTLEGQPADLDKDVSTGDPEALGAGSTNSDGIIHYHPQVGGATGRKAKLGVFLDTYGVKLSDSKLEFPESQGIDPRVYDIDSNDVFDGTSCEGKEAQIKVRVWDDFTSGQYGDKITDFDNLRFTNTGMVFVIAVVPEDFDIPMPASASRLEEFGAIGEGDTSTNDTTVDTVTVDTAVDTSAVETTVDTAPTTDG